MSVEIALHIETEYELDHERLSRSAEVVLGIHECSDCGLTIVITDNEAMRELNLQYRQCDAVTDVLSFPAGSIPLSVASKGQYLGDIVIALAYARERAERAHVAVADALSMLVIHGTLHLLGYDHDTSARFESMWAAQSKALQALQMDPELVGRYGGVVLD